MQELTAAGEHGLVEALRRGDEGAFASLVEELTPSMLRVARLYVPSRAVAEEVVQERSQRRYGLAAFAAARAAERSGAPADYDRERRRQAEWLAERLGLETGGTP